MRINTPLPEIIKLERYFYKDKEYKRLEDIESDIQTRIDNMIMKDVLSVKDRMKAMDAIEKNIGELYELLHSWQEIARMQKDGE